MSSTIGKISHEVIERSRLSIQDFGVIFQVLFEAFLPRFFSVHTVGRCREEDRLGCLQKLRRADWLELMAFLLCLQMIPDSLQQELEHALDHLVANGIG